MSAYRAALLALFVVCGTLVTAVPAGAMPLHGVEDASASVTGEPFTPSVTDERVPAVGPRPIATRNGSANNSSLGADISSFMQSSAAEVGGAVETGMWVAAYNATENRSVRVRLIERQTEDLRDELAQLKQRKAELVAERNATAVSDAAYKAKLGQLVGRINALQAAINATAVRAREVNANVAAVAALRNDTENLTGPEIAAVARNVTGVSVGNGQRGPPDDLGNATGNGNGSGNGNANGNTNGAPAAKNGTTGPPNDVANGTSNESRGNRSDNANAPMVSNQSENGTMPGADTPATPPVGVNDSTSVRPAENSHVDVTALLSPAAEVTSDLVESVSDAFTVRTDALTVSTDAFSFALTAA